MLKVEFSRAALNEMISAARFYDAVRPDYGALFLKNVSRAVEFIRTYPKSGTAIRSGTEIRRHLVKRFHHTVIYSVVDETLHILAVQHPAREPDAWEKTLPTILDT